MNAEVLQVIRAEERRGHIAADVSATARQALIDLPIVRYPTLTLIERAWELQAARLNDVLSARSRKSD